MGNTLKKLRRSKDTTIDGGLLKEEERSNQEYDQKLVKKLILKRKLAPFYKGRDNEEKGEEIQVKDGLLLINTDNEVDNNHNIGKETKLKRTKSQPQAMIDSIISNVTSECPICYQYYPKNINKTVCCQQPLCTKCFVSIKRPKMRVTSCPFCNKSDLTIHYTDPHRQILGKSTHRLRREDIRPYYRPSAAYRSATHSRYGATAPIPRSMAYNGGVLVVYNQHGPPTYYAQPRRQYNPPSSYYRPQRPGYAYRYSNNSRPSAVSSYYNYAMYR